MQTVVDALEVDLSYGRPQTVYWPHGQSFPCEDRVVGRREAAALMNKSCEEIMRQWYRLVQEEERDGYPIDADEYCGKCGNHLDDCIC
jgi:hypothetical protein